MHKRPTTPVTIPLPLKAIVGSLTSACEGGSNYWILKVTKGRKPSRETPSDFGIWSWPVDGGSLRVSPIPEAGAPKATYTLDKAAITRGLTAMAAGSPRHFGNLVGGNDDAETGDVLLQYCLFGEILFG